MVAVSEHVSFLESEMAIRVKEPFLNCDKLLWSDGLWTELSMAAYPQMETVNTFQWLARPRRVWSSSRMSCPGAKSYSGTNEIN